jgi:hypothetical protein
MNYSGLSLELRDSISIEPLREQVDGKKSSKTDVFFLQSSKSPILALESPHNIMLPNFENL